MEFLFYTLLACLILIIISSVSYFVYLMISTARDSRKFDKRIKQYDEEDPIDGYVDYYWFDDDE